MIYLIFRNNNPILNNLDGIRLELVYDVIKEASFTYQKTSFTDPLPLEKIVLVNFVFNITFVVNSEWTSGDEELDEIIRYFQINYPLAGFAEVIEWVSYTKFNDIVFIAQGGFGNIYIATWVDGPRVYWDGYKQRSIRDGPRSVVLKSMKSSNHRNEFIREVMTHIAFTMKSPGIVGLTKIPEQNNYMMILDYQEDGDLRSYLNNKDIKLTWKERYEVLKDIADSLYLIHTNEFMHGDLHPGNIFKKGELYREYYEQLAKDIIINNLRPQKIRGLPSDYEEIIERCWDPNISNRPNASYPYKTFRTSLKKFYEGELNIPEPDIANIALPNNMISRVIDTGI
ncbi:13294_t:CDS:2 [Racocetra fulgida]|uniref:13294_t:CDS:1 n=1 Tax=Racocetra fulgida TaxID=60492 RepID=A0A9N9CWM7_9GLOM|nr:13294_t:CDS:2 [Racocetra fulgida]